MPKLKLVSHVLCPYVQRARIVLAEKSIDCELEFIDLSDKPHWFKSISPLGKVPVLLSDGTALFESSVITEYLDEISSGTLHPESPLDRAWNRSWIEYAASTLDSIAVFYNAPDCASFNHARQNLQQRFEILESILGNEPYFNGEKFCLVDASFATVFRYFDVFEKYEDFRVFSGTPAASQWRKFVMRRSSVKSAVVVDYADRLHQFLQRRDSVLSRIIADRVAA